MPSNKKKNNIMSYLWDVYHKKRLHITESGEVYYVETGGPYAVRHKVANLYKRKRTPVTKEIGLEAEYDMKEVLQ